jgi:alginate O-acetyltransferase complex protein AlgI
METALSTFRETSPLRRGWIGWLPLIVFPSVAAAFRAALPPWIFMWVMAVAIFAGFKWWTWWRAVNRGKEAGLFRSIAFLFLWPGMDAERFLAPDRTVAKPVFCAWRFAVVKTLFGAVLVWGVARWAGDGWSAGWIGMIGFIFVLHFGLFHLLALFWQRCGIDAQPLMRWPARAQSLGDFWGRRWNAGFRDLAFGLLFIRLAGLMPPRLATLAIFLISGLIHEVVITFPARGGYGLPTFYFIIQGTGLLLERSHLGCRLGLRRALPGRLFAFAVIILPVFALFPEPFVVRVMVPFFQAIHALP